MWWDFFYGFLIIKLHSTRATPHNAVRFIITCGVMQLLHFIGGFGWFGCGCAV